jgi:hypothetical protein
MSKTRYLKDTKRFWRIRNNSRVALDKKRTQASFSEKVKIAEKLRSDAEFLRSGVPVSPKK